MAKRDELRETLTKAMNKAIEAGREESKTPEAHWFPCGNAWLSYKCRKNARIGTILKDMGFRWDDYRKAWQSTFYNTIPCIAGMSQSMEYRARIVREMARVLKEEGFEGFYVETWID